MRNQHFYRPAAAAAFTIVATTTLAERAAAAPTEDTLSRPEFVRMSLARKDVTVTASAFGAETVSREGTDEVEATVEGREEPSQCLNCSSGEDEYRRSRTAARASVTGASIEPTSMAINLFVHTTSSGGHRLRCEFGCVAGCCLGLKGEDSPASGTARASAEIRLDVEDSVRPMYYTLFLRNAFQERNGVSQKGDVRFRYEFLAAGGATLSTGALGEQSIEVLARPGAQYLLRLVLEARSLDQGACCADIREGLVAATAEVSFERAPIMAHSIQESSLDPSVPLLNGDRTKSYGAVGVIVKDRIVHCTGTLVGQRTVLTAGHCIVNQQPAIKRRALEFIEGFNANDPTARRTTIVSGRLPTTYADQPLSDDIGLAYLETPLKLANGLIPEPLHKSDPSLDTLKSTYAPVVLVGFGYRVAGPNNNPIDAGLKRRLSIQITELRTRSFHYGDGKTAIVCVGDSGGPAFASTQDGKGTVIVGVASRANAECGSYGVDTRVDVFRPWILSNRDVLPR